MLIEIPNVLNFEQLIEINSLIEQANFVDGKLSAGNVASKVKNNNELEQDTQFTQKLDQIVLGSLLNNPTFRQASFTKRIAGAFYARYSKGMNYGDHVDNPIMGPMGGQYRSDISVTVFLNDPENYSGGELVIQSTFGEKQYKLKAGHAIIYPSSSVHHINPITKGHRFVAVSWIQSMIADPAKRELLFNLEQAKNLLTNNNNSDNAYQLIDISHANLIRMWADI